MELHRIDEGTWELRYLNGFLRELLNRIPEAADPAGDEGVEGRLYSSPTHGVQPEFDAEWREYIQPGLEDQFGTAMSVVQGDLQRLPPLGDDDIGTLLIPTKHADAWLHSLNQARLALATRYDIGEEEMQSYPVGGGDRALARWQIDFYGYLQELLLREIDG